MCASRRSASWPHLVAISLIGIGVASCSADSGRFNEGFGSSNPHSDVTGSVQSAPAGHIESRPLPHLGSADDGTSGGGHGMGSYQSRGEVFFSNATATPELYTLSLHDALPIIVEPGETLEVI